MQKGTAWFLPLVAVAVVAGWTLAGPGSPPTPQAAQTQSTEHTVWSHGHDGTDANEEEHWEKHGGDFPELHSAQDYDRAAQSFVTAPPPGTLTKHRANGDTLFYDPATNTFAVTDRDGEPRTFFRPNSGRAYWDRQ